MLLKKLSTAHLKTSIYPRTPLAVGGHSRGTEHCDRSRARFGQPITNTFGVPTIVLAEAVRAEGSVERVTKLYDVAAAAVRDAVKFENSLAA